ncbi:molybdopterin-containing oxidoreductase family protein [Blastococcus sp. SYSU D00695]
MTITTEISYCRICPAVCGTLVDIEDDRVVRVRGDREAPLSGGYTCPKGRAAPELMNGPDRLTETMARGADGVHRPIAVADATADIAARLNAIIEEHGPDAVALFMGTQTLVNTLSAFVVHAWFGQLGSHKLFSTMTIDQSAKWLVPARMGEYQGGLQSLDEADVWLIAGSNPVITSNGGDGDVPFVMNPANEFKKAKARGMKLIVIDPRQTETSARADIHLRPRPGTDAVVFAGLLHVILENRWYDEDFCAEFVDGLEELRAAVAPATPEFVASRCDIAVEDLLEVARVFGTAERGRISTGTGTNFGPHSNVAEHLADTLNIICGRVRRAGEPAQDGHALFASSPPVARVVPPDRSWETGFRSRVGGHGQIRGELPSSLLPDEILTPGPDRVRALVISGANLVLALADEEKARAALEALDLLVVVDTRMTETARLADYVIAGAMLYERPDHTALMESFMQAPFAHYTPALVPPPGGVVEDWQFYLDLAHRMGMEPELAGQPIPAGTALSSEELLTWLMGGGRVDPDELRAHRHGLPVPSAGMVVAPRPEDDTERLQLVPDDVRAEIAAALEDDSLVLGDGQLLLISRRMKNAMNSLGTKVPSLMGTTYNPALMHPDDLAAHGLVEGAEVEVVSRHGRVRAVVGADPGLRVGTVSLSHMWGTLDKEASVAEHGSNVNRLTSLDDELQTINRMPRMTALPVRIVPAG